MQYYTCKHVLFCNFTITIVLLLIKFYLFSLGVPTLKPYVNPINLQHWNGSTSTSGSNCERIQEQLSSLSVDDQSKSVTTNSETK